MQCKMDGLIDFPRNFARFSIKFNVIKELFIKDISDLIILLYLKTTEITVICSGITYSQSHVCLFNNFINDLPSYIEGLYPYIRIHTLDLGFPLIVLEPYIKKCLEQSKKKRRLTYEKSTYADYMCLTSIS